MDLLINTDICKQTTFNVDYNAFKALKKPIKLTALKGLFPFDCGLIQNDGVNIKVYFRVFDGGIFMFALTDGSDKVACSFFVSNVQGREEDIDFENIVTNCSFDDGTEIVDFMSEKGHPVSLFAFRIFKYIQYEASKSYKRVSTVKKYLKRDLERGDSVEYRPIKLGSGISIVINPKIEDHQKYTRHCEAWGVRGHYRHYKNGKVVFIKPYTKGKGKIKDTIYKL